MPQRPRPRSRAAIGRLLLFLMAVTTLVFWLPFGRSLVEGRTYEWGLFGIGGAGVNQHFWLPTAGVLLALRLRWLGHRGRRLSAAAAVVGTFGLLAAVAIAFALANPDAMVVRGDTLGLQLSLRWLGPLLFGGAALAGLWWARGDRDPDATLRWSPRHTVWTAIVGLLVLASIALLRAGEPHGPSDQHGVRTLALAWLLLDGVLAPRRRRQPRSLADSA